MNTELTESNIEIRLKERAAQTIRTDIEVAATVNRGLAAAYLINLDSGIAVMHDGGVPAKVVTRVLSSPAHRRATDWRY